MSQCYSSGDFKKYFNENMKDLGLPVPQTLFDNFNAAVANAGLILEALGTLGKGATMAEVIKATTGLERLKVAASLGASFYVGAVIGSIAVASGRSLGCGSRISDMFVFLHQNNLTFNDWNSFYVNNPEILDKSSRFRVAYRSKALDGNRAYA
jgi:hypothetical protein